GVREAPEAAMNGHERLVAEYLRLHAAAAARLLEAMPVEQTNAVLGSVDAPTAAPVFAQMLPTYAAQCLELQPPSGGALLLERLATAQDHQVWERNTEAPVINRDEEFIGVISYTDLRKAHRETTRSVDGNGRHDLAEVTELIAIGAGSVWQSLGDLIRREREK